MQIHELKRNTPNETKRRVGRGGNHGKTSGRGTKGQKARAGHSIRPELRDMIKKLPKRRGYRFQSIVDKPAVVNLSEIERAYSVGEVVSPKTLMEKKLIHRINGKLPIVKILSRGILTKKVSVSKCVVSAGSKLAIEKTGGSIA